MACQGLAMNDLILNYQIVLPASTRTLAKAVAVLQQ